ncbi:Uncharacterised protein [Klebsiella pneumoniae subsp. ozaenae]|uniref:Uncharacterized protein n=1 Tax=Klebsiella pneumoniae subsp. ozaenae TaxID=574 RepID=A0A377YTC7_KLEPO|nr:Uncharacterised protein [Klebsiella pneumoniae subsp. ozaenae]
MPKPLSRTNWPSASRTNIALTPCWTTPPPASKKLAAARRQKQNGFYQAWVQWTMGSSPLKAMQLEATLKREQPGMLTENPEAY